MRLDKSLYDPILLKGNILFYSKCLIKLLIRYCKFVSEAYYSNLSSNLGFPHGSDGKESTCNVGELGSMPGLGRSPRGGNVMPLQYFCLEDLHGQRSPVGYRPWGCK